MNAKYAKFFIAGLFVLLEFILLKYDLIRIIGVAGASFPAAAAFAPAVSGIIGYAAFPIILLTNTSYALVNGASLNRAFLLILVSMGLPLACASLYFGRRNVRVLAIPAACMIAFWLHPVGSQVWYFALLWLVPAAIHYMHGARIGPVLDGIGAAFVDHSVGSVLYLYALDIPAAAWQAAFFQAVFERLTFGLGIAASYYALKYVTLNVEAMLNRRYGLDFSVSKLFGVEMH
ncbi:MAG: hypothetical protein WAX07_01380 [Candidatus Altiarchaeia archaeon]